MTKILQYNIQVCGVLIANKLLMLDTLPNRWLLQVKTT